MDITLENLKDMKIIYIAHPISGDIEGNLEKIITIIRELNIYSPRIVPFAPYWVDCHALDDTSMQERERGIKNDHTFFVKGVIDEVWLFGDRISEGMKHEIDLARKLGIPVIPKTKETKTSLEISQLSK